MCFRSEGIAKFLEIGATLTLLPSVPSTFRTDLVLWDKYLFQARVSEETDNRQTADGLRVGIDLALRLVVYAWCMHI